MIQGFWKIIFLCLVTASITACGNSQPTMMTGAEQEPTPRATFFESTQDLQVNGREIPAGSQVTILEDVSAHYRLGVETSDEAFELWLSAEELKDLNLHGFDDIDPYDADGYQIDDEADFLGLRKKMTYCYRYVKLYLLDKGLVKSYLPGASAYMAASILPKHGFKKVSRKPSNAIVNDVCVYRGGPSGHGHIEVMTSKGWYYGYGYKQSPIKNRTFIGCFHK